MGLLKRTPAPEPVEDCSSALPSLNLSDYSDKYANILAVREQLNKRVNEIRDRHASILNDPERRAQFQDGMAARVVGAPIGQVAPSFMPADLVNAVASSGLSLSQATRAGVGAELAEQYVLGLAETEEIEKHLRNTEHQLAAARLEASRSICEAIKSEHKHRVEALGMALIAAAKAHAEYQELADKLNGANVAWSTLRGMPFRPVDATDAQSRVRRWLKEAIEFGFLNAEAVPASWRK
ncbi:MAG: hypothetical protein WCO00_18070 [Rhodospirillaceae bacterium]